MLIKYLIEIGNSKYLLIDKPLRDLLNITDKVQVDIENGKMIIQPVKK
jgi:hypothetical protein